MFNKMVTTLLFVFLTISPANAASIEQPNSVTAEPNSRIPPPPERFTEDITPIANSEPNIQKGLFADLVESSPNSVPANPVLQDIFDKANKGDPNAQWQLGEIYYFGRNGLPQDYNEAFKWYKKAAEQGGKLAQCQLGYMYYEGEGVQNNYKEAKIWFTKSAEQKNITAQYFLAGC